MRKATSGWEDDYGRRLVGDGFRRSRAASTIFYHPKTQVRVVVHGDDFTFAGTESELRKTEAKMHEWYDVKVHGILGSGKRDVHEIEILGKNLTWTDEGLEYEGSSRSSKPLNWCISPARRTSLCRPSHISLGSRPQMWLLLIPPQCSRFRPLLP